MEIDDKIINLMFRRIEELNAKVNVLLEKNNHWCYPLSFNGVSLGYGARKERRFVAARGQ